MVLDNSILQCMDNRNTLLHSFTSSILQWSIRIPQCHKGLEWEDHHQCSKDQRKFTGLCQHKGLQWGDNPRCFKGKCHGRQCHQPAIRSQACTVLRIQAPE